MDQAVDNHWPRALSTRFKPVRKLGTGGVSSVFLVEELKSPGFQMALKLLNPKYVGGDSLGRFRKEFEVLTSIQHTNIVEAYEITEQDGCIAYLMEHVEGRNLLEVLRDEKISHSNIDNIFSQVLAALGELHKNGLAHRDVKLENVLVGDNGIIKLSDLGLLKQTSGEHATEAGILLGTTQYLPPEYVKHGVYDFRSDIYAVGLMLFECLVGKRWLNDKNGAKAIRYLCDRNFEFPKLALSGLPHKYQRILERALAVQPWKRYKSAERMKLAILSADGNSRETPTVEVTENFTIQSVNARLKTQTFVCTKSRRQKWLYLSLCSAGVALSILCIGIASSRPTSESDLPKSKHTDQKLSQKVADSRLNAKSKGSDSAESKDPHVSTKSP